MKDDETVFRQRMVERLAAADEADEPLNLDPLRGWPLIVAVLLVLVVASVWAVSSSSAVTVEGLGVVRLDDGDRATALLFTAFETELRPGQPVRLHSRFGDPATFHGRVLDIAREPSARQAMAEELGDPDLAGELYRQGRRWRVAAVIAKPASSPRSARRWVEAQIEVGRRRPIDELWIGDSADTGSDTPTTGGTASAPEAKR